jgi:L-amino acid N-acyltransferase YncA
MSVTTRLAGPEDAAAIARIYNQGIEERVATFETEPRSPEDIRAQLASKGDRYPTVVVERDEVGAREPAAQPRERGTVHARDDTVTRS